MTTFICSPNSFFPNPMANPKSCVKYKTGNPEFVADSDKIVFWLLSYMTEQKGQTTHSASAPTSKTASSFSFARDKCGLFVDGKQRTTATILFAGITHNPGAGHGDQFFNGFRVVGRIKIIKNP